MDEMRSPSPKPFVFVLMPFGKEFDRIYQDGIKQAATDVGAYAERVDDQMFTSDVLDRVFNQINKADVIIADMTGRKANVFYEVGYAHGLGKFVILLTQSAEDIPFNLMHQRHIIYSGSEEILRTTLAPNIRWALENRNRKTARLSVWLGDIHIPESIQGPGPVCALASESRLPFHVKNISDVPGAIVHLSLFAEAGAILVPTATRRVQRSFDEQEYQITPRGPIPLPKRVMREVDEESPMKPTHVNPDIRAADCEWQFKLSAPVNILPAGAIDLVDIPTSLREIGDQRCRMCLRIHFGENMYDFPFVVQINA